MCKRQDNISVCSRYYACVIATLMIPCQVIHVDVTLSFSHDPQSKPNQDLNHHCVLPFKMQPQKHKT